MNAKTKHIHILRDSIVLYLHVENGSANLKGKIMKISAIMLGMRIEQSKAEKQKKVKNDRQERVSEAVSPCKA